MSIALRPGSNIKTNTVVSNVLVVQVCWEVKAYSLTIDIPLKMQYGGEKLWQNRGRDQTPTKI